MPKSDYHFELTTRHADHELSLANAEIFLTLAYLFRRFDFELYDTTAARDVETTNDSFVGMADLSSPGVRMKVVKDRLGSSDDSF